MRSASDIDWLGRHGRTIAKERRPESRIQTGRQTLVKGRGEFTQVLFKRRDRGRTGRSFGYIRRLIQILYDVLTIALVLPQSGKVGK